METQVVLVVVLPISLLLMVQVVQEMEHHGQEHQEMTLDQDGVVMVVLLLQILLIMEVQAVVVPLMVKMEAAPKVEMAVVDIKFPLHIKIQRQIMDLLDLVAHTSGLPVAVEVEFMLNPLVLRV
jgi:hypothetical protein